MIDIEEPDMLDAVRDQLQGLGYRGEMLQENYPFSDFMTRPVSARQSVRRIKLAAFADEDTAIENACFGVTFPADDSPQSIAPYRALGAPQVLALHPAGGYVRRWKMAAKDEPKPLEEFRFDEIAAIFQRNHDKWQPQRIIDARTLAPAKAELTLDFFDAGFLPALEAALQSKLKRNIARILAVCKTVYERERSTEKFEDVLAPVFRLVFRLLAAKMLIDRGHQPQWIDLTAPAVIAAVDEFYFPGQTTETVLQDRTVQEEAWRQVKAGLDLQNLSVETLAYLYESAFVTEESRRNQSIHSTPPEVAEYVIRQLPIEKLPIMERRVFEPFTGAAPFLTASLRRLRELLPKDIAPMERHKYLLEMLSGIENEPFAREIAKYALILADYPNGDSWRISGQDAFTGPDFEQYLQEANIVLCNPPYRSFIGSERENANDSPAFTQEVEALRRVVARRPAMFGFVLPRSFLDRQDFQPLRLAITEHYKRVSVTILPERTFSIASQEVAVITAHNVELPGMPYSYAQVTSKGYDAFRWTGEPTWKDSYPELLRRNADVVLARTALQSVWDALANYEKFGTLAEIHRGIEYKTGLLAECVSNEPQEDFVPGVQTARDYLEPYAVRDYQYLCNKPEVMRYEAYLLPWNEPKVVVNRARSSSGYWNIAGAVEDMELLASQQFYGMWPTNGTPIELLAAIISGPVANAYLYNYRTGRDNQIRLIEQIPAPSFTEEQTEFLVWAVQEYYAQRGQWLASEGLNAHFEAKCLELLYWIDAVVLEAYTLPAELERELLSAFNNVPRRPLPFHFPGYGAEYERAKETLQKERAHRATLKQYHALVDKTFLDGVTTTENEEKERLGLEIDDYYAPFYQSMIEKLKAGKM